MATIFFFYGLSFIVFGIVTFMISGKVTDGFPVKDIRLLGIFALIHGMNEWVDMLKIAKVPVDINVLEQIGVVLLPVSFLFLFIYGYRYFFGSAKRSLGLLWVLSVLVWVWGLFSGKTPGELDILARYFICFPGTLLSAWRLSSYVARDKAPSNEFKRLILMLLSSGYVIYGVFSGIVTPKGSILFSGVVNYENFINIFHFPVQFFRMLCAIFIAVTLVIIFFSGRTHKGARKIWGIRAKMSLFIFVSGFIIFISSLAVMYNMIYHYMSNDARFRNNELVEMKKESILERVEADVENILVYISDPLIVRAVKEQNFRLASVSGSDLMDYFRSMDDEWENNDPAGGENIRRMLGSDVSAALRSVADKDTSVDEFFITDIYGGLVGMSELTSDYYQADELWWQKAFNEGKGRIYMSRIYYDESTGARSISVSTPITDEDGKVIGVAKVVLGIERLLLPVKNIRIGGTGHAALFDNDYKLLGNGLNKEDIWVFHDPGYINELMERGGNAEWRDPKTGVTWAVTGEYVSCPLFDKDYSWVFAVAQDKREIYRNLNSIVLNMVLIMLVSIVLLVILSSYFGNKLSVSILRLREKIRFFMDSGEITDDGPILSEDEVEDLDADFLDLVENLGKTTVSREYFNNIIENIADILIVTDPDGKINRVNEAACRLLGYDEEYLIGRDIYVLFPTDGLFPNNGVSGVKTLKTDIIDQETKCKGKSGDFIDVILSVSVVRKSSCPESRSSDDCESFVERGKHCENVQGIVFIAKDIRETIEAREAVEQSEKRFMDILHASNDAILLIDSETFVEANEATARMLEYPSREEVLMTHPSELSPPVQPDGRDSFEKANEMMRIAVEEGFNRFEWMHRKKTGEDFPVEVSLTPITYKGRTIIHCLWRDLTAIKISEEAARKTSEELKKNERALKNMLFDIQKTHNDLKDTQKQLVQSEKMASIGQLAAGIAHEINNPLGFITSNLSTLDKYISGLSEVLRAQEALRKMIDRRDMESAAKIQNDITLLEDKLDVTYILSDVDQLLRETNDGLERIKNIVIDLKTFSRKDDETKIAVDLNDVIEGVINIVWNEIKYKATLDKEYGDIPQVECNSQQVGQVFINLLVNSAQAMDDQGNMKIKTYSVDGKVYAEISDTGKGIPEENIEKIFEPFFTTKKQGEGTGLGLSISYDIIKSHGGEMSVESKVGEGTTFTITLPAGPNGGGE